MSDLEDLLGSGTDPLCHFRQLLGVEPEYFRRRLSEHRAQLVLRDAAEEQLATLAQHPSVCDVQIRSPNLEEIFVAYMRQGTDSQTVTEEATAR